MKVNEQRKKLSQMNKQELTELLVGYRRDLFGTRLNAATAHIKDYSQFKKLKQNIARVLTYLQQIKNKV